ncbi:MAG: hypothetical protein K8W52_38270 [Deltaproteobacteria bacterium]|nr:hypothetical protein [Deltaproteobacteria bacterium]
MFEHTRGGRRVGLVALMMVGCGTHPAPTPGSSTAPVAGDALAAAPDAAGAAGGAAQGGDVATSARGLRWQLRAVPPRLTMKDRAAFRLRIEVTNTAAAPVDASDGYATFTLDGQASQALDLAFGNGGREARWRALPPGDTVSDERAMGEDLFPAPGAYAISAAIDGVRVATTIEVLP